MNVLQIHEKVEIKEGAEVYIQQLNTLLPHYGMNSYWLALSKQGNSFHVNDSKTGHLFSTNNPLELQGFLLNFIQQRKIQLINIHNLFEKILINLCLKLLPVVKSVHSPVMVCPGRDKFWRYSERPCTIPYGLHCFWHIYSEGCSNRHPSRVLDAWNYVRFESKEAAFQYKKIIVMSDYMKAGLLECKVPESQISVNPYFTTEVEEGICTENTDKKKHLIFIGRLVSSKGPHIMIRSLAELFKTREDIHLDIVGDGIMKSELLELVKNLQLEGNVSFHGWLHHAEMGRILKNSYLLIFPSVYPEAFGISGIEAMMWGKPVVGFNVGGVSTWLKNDFNGILLDQTSSNSLKKRNRKNHQ